MRFLRLIFVVALAIVLIAVALANRETVTLSAFPANFGQYLGGRWSVALPLFLVIFLAFALGMLAGLVWEWLRESHIRREARAQGHLVQGIGAEAAHVPAPREQRVELGREVTVEGGRVRGHRSGISAATCQNVIHGNQRMAGVTSCPTRSRSQRGSSHSSDGLHHTTGSEGCCA